MTLSFVFLFTSSGEIPILYLQPEKLRLPEGSLPVKANIGIGPSWVISPICNSLEPGSSVGTKAKKRGETAKKSGWLEIFFFAFSPPLRSLVWGYIYVMSLLILQLESTLSRIPTQKMTKRSKEDKVLWTCFVFLRGLFTRGFRITAWKFAHVYAMKQSAEIFVSTDLDIFVFCFCFVCLFETGAPNDCFLSDICSEKQRLPRFFIVWGRLKSSRWPFHSCTIFKAYLINALRFSEVSFVPFYSPG